MIFTQHRQRICMPPPRIAGFLIALFATAAWAQSGPISVQTIGVSYLEAPPGRDKKIAPFGASQTLEKVEINAVANVPHRLIVDTPFMGKNQSVRVSALHADKTVSDLGGANVSSFLNVSEDRHKALLVFGINRLPDKAALAVMFNGTIPLQVAKTQTTKTSTFQGKAGGSLDFGIGALSVLRIEANKLILKGSDGLQNMSKLTLITADGRSVQSERTAYSRMGNDMESTWEFKGPLAPGKLQAMFYEGLESIDVPIKITVGRPW